MSTASKVATKLVKDSGIIDSRRESDTIKLWENYRDQALQWRSLALMQIPATLILLIFSVFLYAKRTIVLNVPRQPLPGTYPATDVPDDKFIENATDFLNLVATYQSASARPQFRKAREMLDGKMLSRFEVEMIGTELKVIENTSRTQIFFMDPTKTKIVRSGNDVTVQIEGTRIKYVAGKDLPPLPTVYAVTMSTLPRNTLNPFGIVISNVNFETVKTDI